jgi:hypothetical protein
VFIDILKMVLTLLGGGLAGALLNEWFRRRGAGVQSIPLIERVNRLVSPELKGFTLARVAGEGQTRRLEEIKNVREYQFTLRNTSSVHLQNSEIQFEFPTEDVEAWAERPALSKTAPELVNAVVTEPWKRGYRWRIPQLPSTDSVEFTFRSVDPVSEEYEVALYNSDRVVIERSKGEPASKRSHLRDIYSWSMLVVVIAGLCVAATTVFIGSNHDNLSKVSGSGCALTVVSSFQQFNTGSLPWQGPWQIKYQVWNDGTQKCVVQSDQLFVNSVAIEAGEYLERTGLSQTVPKLVIRNLSFGPDSPNQKAKVTMYSEASVN